MVDAHEAPSVATPLHLDLRGKTVEEVAEILRQNGYRVSDPYIESAWGEPNIFNPHPTQDDRDQLVWRIPINWRDSPNLTIVGWNGKEHTLRPGHEPFFFEALPGKREAGWGWANAHYLMK
jgi:hypothetical protein